MEEKSSVDVKLVLVLIMATCRGLVLGQNYPVCTVPQITVINQILDRLTMIEEKLNANITARIDNLERNCNTTSQDIARIDNHNIVLGDLVESIGERMETLIANITTNLKREKAINDPNWFSPFNGFQYRVTTTKQNWKNSMRACQNLGGHLAYEGIKNNGLRRRIAVALELENTWIGLSDRGLEGDWRWLDQDLATPQNTQWFRGEPSNSGGNQHCGEIWGRSFDFQLNDDYCSKEQSALCERRL